MPPYLPLVSLNRSNKVRINGQTIPALSQILADIDTYSPNDAEGPAYVDLGATSEPGTPVWKEVAYHSSIGQVLVYGALANNLVQVTGLFTTADGSDLVLTVSSGTVKDLVAGTVLAVPAAQTVTVVADGTHPRIDTIQINKTTGVVSFVAGTPAVSPVAPAAATGNIALSHVAIATSATSVAQSNVTDVAPRS
jgi:hypothetical protein